MNEYNDYVSITRRWLKDYNTFKATVASMTADIKTQEEMLERAMDLGAPIAMYDNMPKGGSGELTTVERQTQERMRRRESIERAKLNRDEIQRIIDRVDRAVSSLDVEEQELLQGFYRKGKSWLTLGYEHHYSERWARKRGTEAVKKMAFLIFGVKACPQQLSFVFAEW